MNITEPFSEKEFPEGIYAVIYVKGTPDDITQAQIYLFSCWLPNSGYEPDNLPILERYLNDVRVDGFLESEIMIKLKPLK
jgi:AraC family transcriptional regulator